MALSNKYLLIAICLLLLGSCKKTATLVIEDKKDDSKEPPAMALKSLTIIQGNNQIGHIGLPLDTVYLKATFNTPPTLGSLRFNYKGDGVNDNFFFYTSRVEGNDAFIKGIWRPSGNSVTPSATIYMYHNCTTEQIITGTCSNVDSVKLYAKLRRPWAKVFTGKISGYNVLRDIQFSDNSNGIAVGEGMGVVRTTDGGKAWKATELTPGAMGAYSISFAGRDTALLNVVNNYAFFTYDAGKTFFQPTWNPPIQGDQSSAAYLLQSRKVIYTVGIRGSIAKTTDGGLNWDLSGSFKVLNNLRDIAAAGRDTLYACGDVGFIAKTTNAGKTWQQQPLSVNNNLTRLYVVNNSLALACGDYGAVLRTADGGNFWLKVETGLRAPVIAVRFFGKHGYIVTRAGEIAETTDYGLNWSVKYVGIPDTTSGYFRAFIKDETVIYAIQQSDIFSYDLTQP